MKKTPSPPKTSIASKSKVGGKDSISSSPSKKKMTPQLQKFLKSDSSQVRRSLDVESTVSTSSGSDSPQDQEASRAGSVFCWEFQGIPVKKSYSKASSLSPNSVASSSSAGTSTATTSPSKKILKTIRKDFFSSVKRTRILSPSSSSGNPLGALVHAASTSREGSQEKLSASINESTTQRTKSSRRVTSTAKDDTGIDRNLPVEAKDDHEKEGVGGDSGADSTLSSSMILKVGDCAIFCSGNNNSRDEKEEGRQQQEESNSSPQLPFIGRIESFWREVKIHPPLTSLSPVGGESSNVSTDYNLRKGGKDANNTPTKRSNRRNSPVKGSVETPTSSPVKTVTSEQDYDSYQVSLDDEEKMMVKVRWFYHPQEAVTKNKKLNPLKMLKNPEGALFESLTHSDENDVQTISCKCLVLPYDKFKKKKDKVSNASSKNKKSSKDGNNNSTEGDPMNKVYYLAGKYEPLIKEITYDAGVPLTSPLV